MENARQRGYDPKHMSMVHWRDELVPRGGAHDEQLRTLQVRRHAAKHVPRLPSYTARALQRNLTANGERAHATVTPLHTVHCRRLRLIERAESCGTTSAVVIWEARNTWK